MFFINHVSSKQQGKIIRCIKHMLWIYILSHVTGQGNSFETVGWDKQKCRKTELN